MRSDPAGLQAAPSVPSGSAPEGATLAPSSLLDLALALEPHEQHSMAERLAANVGYDLVEEPTYDGVNRDLQSEACGILTDAAQILDTVSREWAAEGQWSAWDQQVRDRLSDWLKAFHTKALSGGAVGDQLGTSEAKSCGTNSSDLRALQSKGEAS